MKKNNKVYVQVYTGAEWLFVTRDDWQTKQAFWEKGKPAVGFTRGEADDLVFGLTVNGYVCRIVYNPYSTPEDWHN